MANFELTGFLAQDPEIKYFESGKNKTSFSIPESKGKEHPTIWRHLEAWGTVAEALMELKKNDRIKCTGFTKVESYNNKDGKEVIKDVWVVETFGIIDKKES
jgi:single-stranded DNA-binding protein